MVTFLLALICLLLTTITVLSILLYKHIKFIDNFLFFEWMEVKENTVCKDCANG